MRFLQIIFTALALLSVQACSSDKAIKTEEQATAEQLYERAVKAMQAYEYVEATHLFEEVERQYPYSELATKAQIMGAVASYKDERYDDAEIALDRFIQLHPGNEQIDYAYYLKAMCNYDQISDIRRDQGMTKVALTSLDTLINRFPQSDYRRDAILKRDLVLDHLAGKEMEIGRYYLNRGQLNSAIKRFSEVVKEYQTTTHTAEALHRLVECYMTLGLKHEALRIASVLGHNYPGSPWYEKTYALMDDDMRQKLVENRSFWDRTIDSIFKPD